MKKKLVAFILILIFIINTAIPGNSYAETNTGTFEDAQNHQSQRRDEPIKESWEEQKATISPGGSSQSVDLKLGQSSSSTAVGTLSGLFALLPLTINRILAFIVNATQPVNNANYSKTNYFLIQDLLLGKYYIFNIDFMEYTYSSNNAADIVKKNVSTWYFALRTLAIVGNLVLLIYIGIRMIISTVGEQQAKYKKMFFNWLVSFILVFLMHYVFVILFELQTLLINLVKTIIENWDNGANATFEKDLIVNAWQTFYEAKGWNTVLYVIEIIVFTYYQIKFSYLYFKRFLTVGFLVLISPLITLADAVYSVENRVPIFRVWMKEIIFNIFIQVIHATTYTIFIISASEIAKEVPIVAMIFLMSLSRAEKIIKSSFGLKGKLSDVKFIDKIKQSAGKNPRLHRH